MSVRRQLAWCLTIVGAAILGALFVKVMMDTAPGFIPVVALSVFWIAQELPAWDFDAELNRLLTEA